MNSRDAAYFEAAEEEALRKAIAASVADIPESIDGRSRKAKRSRSDSEE